MAITKDEFFQQPMYMLHVTGWPQDAVRPDEPLEEPVEVFVGGAPPAPALLEKAARLNLHVTHLYGLTETYGPIAVCAWNPDWDELPDDEQAALRARQGVGTIVSERMRVVDEDMADVPADGESLGEVCMRGDNVMTGYYRDVLSVQTRSGAPLVNTDLEPAINVLARRSTPEATLHRIDALLGCRTALEGNVAPLLAVEATLIALVEG